jgi:hypothetical protein
VCGSCVGFVVVVVVVVVVDQAIGVRVNRMAGMCLCVRAHAMVVRGMG